MRARLAALIISVLAPGPAGAMVGGAQPAGELGRSAVLIVGSRGNSCTGVALARDLILTAAHCVLPGAEYRLVEFDANRRPSLRDVAQVERHPQFNLGNFTAHRVTADVALLKLKEPFGLAPARLAPGAPSVKPGDAFTVVGYGVAIRGDGRSGGTARAATLVATGRPGNLQIRLVDPATGGDRAGLGACTGDSGAPVLRDGAVIGVVSWSTGPGNSAGCGGLTGVTPLSLYRGWIVATARRLGSPVEP